MTDSTFPAGAAAPARPANVAELAQQTPGVIQGARWFWWIAGLSLVNVACDVAQANISFVMGLAFTQIAHAMFHSSMGIAFAIDALFIGGFYLLGRQAQRGQLWAFIVGIVVYVCDALIYVKYEDWMPVAFHALALFYTGKALMSLLAAQKATGVR